MVQALYYSEINFNHTQTLLAMKKTAIFLSVFLGLLCFNAYGQSDTTKVKQPGKEITLQIEGMACGFCARNLKNSLEKLDGITVHQIDPEKGFAELSFEPGKAPSDAQLKESVENAGFVLKKIIGKQEEEPSSKIHDQ